jgi:4,5-DOPA dioxygenase extradiol
MVARDRDRLVHTLSRASHAARAHPRSTSFPLLIAAGAAAIDAPVTVLPGGITHGVLSMESHLFGKVDMQMDEYAPRIIERMPNRPHSAHR